MEGLLKALQAALPFLEQYPVWVRLAVASWVLFSAGLVAVFILVPRQSPPLDSAPTEEALPEVAPDDRPVPQAQSDATGQQVERARVDSTAPSLDEVLQTLDDRNLTKLQKSQFVRRHRGRAVQWEGVVLQVQRAYESIPDSEIHVVFRSPSDPDPGLRGIIVATFPPSAEAELAPLAEGDRVVLAGTLEFLDTAADHSPSLRDCSLVSFSKSSLD